MVFSKIFNHAVMKASIESAKSADSVKGALKPVCEDYNLESFPVAVHYHVGNIRVREHVYVAVDKCLNIMHYEIR